MSKIVAIIQARIGSTRLPGKVMNNLIGLPMITHIVQRVSRSRFIDDFVVAIPNSQENDCLKELCEFNKWKFYRGSEEDVLDRFYYASKIYKADVIIRITADCPIIDPELIDNVICEFKNSNFDYMSNICPVRTYPRGLDTEVIRFTALEKSWFEDTNIKSREHVTSYIRRNQNKFKIGEYRDECDNHQLRWTVDTPEDFDLITKIYDHFGDNLFSWNDTLKYIQANPALTTINNHIEQKNMIIV